MSGFVWDWSEFLPKKGWECVGLVELLERMGTIGLNSFRGGWDHVEPVDFLEETVGLCGISLNSLRRGCDHVRLVYILSGVRGGIVCDWSKFLSEMNQVWWPSSNTEYCQSGNQVGAIDQTVYV